MPDANGVIVLGIAKDEKTPCVRPFNGKSRLSLGPLAQLAERLNGIEEVSGSTPLGSTSLRRAKRGRLVGTTKASAGAGS